MNPAAGRAATLVCAGALAVVAPGCAAPAPDHELYEQRIAELQDGFEDDPAVQAQVDEVRAALEHERGEAPIEEFELRVRDTDDGDNNDLRVLARVPLPNPGERRAERAVRRAETEASVSRLEETVLERSAEECLLAIDGHVHRERSRLYETYAKRQRGLLEWSQQWRKSGVVNERAATRFEIESMVKLATRIPDPAPPGWSGRAALPAIAAPVRPLDQSLDLILGTVRKRHPAVALRTALSDRYGAMSKRAESRGRPWFEFVDLGWESRQSRDNAVGAQVAVRVPIGSTASAEASRYRALRRSQLRDADGLIEERARLGLLAVQEIDRFESNAARWQQLLEVAERAERVGERWWRERLARPSQVSTLFEQAYDARSAVLKERERSGVAGCRLLALTGVSVEDWPRTE